MASNRTKRQLLGTNGSHKMAKTCHEVPVALKIRSSMLGLASKEFFCECCIVRKYSNPLVTTSLINLKASRLSPTLANRTNLKHFAFLQLFLKLLVFKYFKTFQNFLRTKKIFYLRNNYQESKQLCCFTLGKLGNCHHIATMHKTCEHVIV